MKPTDFAFHLSHFFSDYLLTDRNCSKNTIRSYRDTFKLLLIYFASIGKRADKVQLKDLTSDTLRNFFIWLEEERKCGINTRNQRLAAIKSFLNYVSIETPENLFEIQKCIAIRQKKYRRDVVEYLSIETIKSLLDKPDRRTKKGLRDLAILALMYDSAARVQEVINLSIKDFQSGDNPTIKITGKGNKVRLVPLSHQTAKILDQYSKVYKLKRIENFSEALFFNSSMNRFTPEGINYILKKYYAIVHDEDPETPSKIHCHVLRHSRAMHLLNSNVSLIYIRDFLGHEDVQATQIYAKADANKKREVYREATPPDWVDTNLPDWNKVDGLIDFLEKLV